MKNENQMFIFFILNFEFFILIQYSQRKKAPVGAFSY
jgi:hypothetical protein